MLDLMLRRAVPLLYVLVILWSSSAFARDDLNPPQIVHEGCEFYQSGQDYIVQARFYDESAIFDPKLIYRQAGSARWENLMFHKLEGTENFEAKIEAKMLKGKLEYFIEVFDEYGNGPARLGSPEAPLGVKPSSKAPDCEQISEKMVLNLAEGSSKPFKPGFSTVLSPVAGQRQYAVCEQKDRPIYCSEWFWSAVTSAALLAGSGGFYYWLNRDQKVNPVSRIDIHFTGSGPAP